MAKKRTRKQGRGAAGPGRGGKKHAAPKKPKATARSTGRGKETSQRGKRARPAEKGKAPVPSKLAAGAPWTTGRAEPPWVGDLRARWQSVNPAHRRKALDGLARATEPADPQERLERLNAALADLDMDRTDVTCLVIALYYDWLVAGRADIVGQIAAQIREVLTGFQQDEG